MNKRLNRREGIKPQTLQLTLTDRKQHGSATRWHSLQKRAEAATSEDQELGSLLAPRRKPIDQEEILEELLLLLPLQERRRRSLLGCGEVPWGSADREKSGACRPEHANPAAPSGSSLGI